MISNNNKRLILAQMLSASQSPLDTQPSGHILHNFGENSGIKNNRFF